MLEAWPGAYTSFRVGSDQIDPGYLVSSFISIALGLSWIKLIRRPENASMDETVINPAEEEEGTFELGQILGSRRAFSAIAGRCSAADAECLRRIREQRL